MSAACQLRKESGWNSPACRIHVSIEKEEVQLAATYLYYNLSFFQPCLETLALTFRLRDAENTVLDAKEGGRRESAAGSLSGFT